MISLYSGTPGSGKSLHQAHEIREKLRWGRYVISTCDIDTRMCFMNKLQEFLFNVSKGRLKVYPKHDSREDNFYYVPIEEITPEYLYEFAARHHVYGKEHQTFVFLDECVSIFSPTVISQDNDRWNAWDTFFRKHRHLGFDVILIPQSKRLIARKVLEYAEFEVKHYNKKHHGTFGFFVSLFAGGLFCYTTSWRGTKKPIEQKFFTYKPFYGQMYDSYAMFETTLSPYKRRFELEDKKPYLSVLAGQLQAIAKIREFENKEVVLSG